MQTIPVELRRRIEKKRLIFTVTTGRSGTKYLARLMDLIDGVTSRHEPWPHFVEVMREAQTDARVASEFLASRKLEAIADEEGQTYVETSHLFCKGFLQPILDLGVIPDIIILDRPHRPVALSMFRLSSIPGTSEWYLSPDDPDVLALPGWEDMHDYQLCYWYCLEIERRAFVYSGQLRERNAVVTSTNLNAITTEEGFNKLLSNLALPEMSAQQREAFHRLAQHPVNRKLGQGHHKELPDAQELDTLEAEVRLRVHDGLTNPGNWKGSARSATGNQPRWIDEIKAIRHVTDELLDDGQTIILIDDGKLPEYVTARSGILPLMEHEGVYWGRPATSEDAIRELQRLMEKGATFLLVARDAFWWLEEYHAFHRYLRNNFACLEENNFAIVFSLTRDASLAVSDPVGAIS